MQALFLQVKSQRLHRASSEPQSRRAAEQAGRGPEVLQPLSPLQFKGCKSQALLGGLRKQ